MTQSMSDGRKKECVFPSLGLAIYLPLLMSDAKEGETESEKFLEFRFADSSGYGPIKPLRNVGLNASTLHIFLAQTAVRLKDKVNPVNPVSVNHSASPHCHSLTICKF